jgi:hypothetical protein
MLSRKMKVYFVGFLKIQISLSFATNFKCELSNARINVLITNVTYN